jgi:hypothetical protein
VVVLRGEPAPREPQLVAGAAGDREVALPRIERTFDDTERLDELRDDEMEIGVAVAVEVACLVDRNARSRELDVLPFARVEAAEEHLLGVAVTALVGEEDAGGELEEVGSVLARHTTELADAEVEVAGAAARHGRSPAHVDRLLVRLRRVLRRGARGGEESRSAAQAGQGSFHDLLNLCSDELLELIPLNENGQPTRGCDSVKDP